MEVPMSKRKKTKPEIDKKDIYEDFEPCGRDLAEMLQDEKAFMEENPDYDPGDQWTQMQIDIARGK